MTKRAQIGSVVAATVGYGPNVVDVGGPLPTYLAGRLLTQDARTRLLPGRAVAVLA